MPQVTGITSTQIFRTSPSDPISFTPGCESVTGRGGAAAIHRHSGATEMVGDEQAFACLLIAGGEVF